MSSLYSKIDTKPDFQENVVSLYTIPFKEAETVDLSECSQNLPPGLIEYLHSQGIHSLYTHQFQALQELDQRHSVVVTTGTSSGKSLIYQAAIFKQYLTDPNSTALLLYPTKALTNDQLKPFQNMQEFILKDKNSSTLSFSSVLFKKSSSQNSGIS